MLQLSALLQLPRWSYVIAAFLWAGVIMVLLLLPRTSIPSIKIWQADKVIHAGLFAVQALLLWLSIRPQKQQSHSKKAPVLSFIATSLYGISTELIQKAAVTRTADPLDAIADITGAGIAAYLIFRWETTTNSASSSRSES